MTRILVDDQSSEVSSLQKSVGEALQDILSSLPPDRVVTEIFLDGKKLGNAPNEISNVKSHCFTDLQVRTMSKTMWTESSLELAISSGQQIQQSLIRVLQLYWDKDSISAGSLFARCLDGLKRFSQTLVVAQGIPHIDFKNVSVQGVRLSQVEMELRKILNDFISYPVESDFESVLETIEYRLLPNLHVWNQGLIELRNAISKRET